MAIQSLCEAGHCRRDRRSGEFQPRTAAPGQRLCQVCRDRLRDDLGSLPALYEDCGEVLSPARPGITERVSSGRARQGIRLNEAALQARGDMIPVLASWAGTVIAERRVGGPSRREAGPLAAFLARHVDWLAAHPAAGECAAEVRRAVNVARSALEPRPAVPQELGPCPVGDCPERVLTVRGPGQTHAVRCTAGHVLPPDRWLLLSSLA
ncbi:hypothetical protein [Streptomyces genisteinicus]|uniref:Uncharacterized protein n=1 Tax=Streptomyces genisteinicus TaxID=2768068 RepID=A0A7H0I531_9ACTN|nr:hypothetical protein [Streptomyces genisteinicus]QNP67897.1 hypothetical protein IAG43_33695 [Streptomyces genisteinicus]